MPPFSHILQYLILFAEITLVKAFETFAVAGFVLGHFMYGVVHGVEVLLLGHACQAHLVLAGAALGVHALKIKNQKVVPHSLRPSNIHSANKKERIGKNMELKFVIPNMEKTFGNLEFAGEDKVVQRRINGRLTVLSRSYNLYSDVQRADDIVVVLPAEAGEKHFGFEERVKLVNPRITAEGYKIGTRGFTNYLLHADDMIKE